MKPLVVGHWGTTPGQNFIYVHLNRVITKYDLDMIYIAGPGHGGPALVANTYLEGSYSEIYPNISQDEPGMKRLLRQFSFPGGISSHSRRRPRGRVTRAASWAIARPASGRVYNPELIVACVVGDGERNRAAGDRLAVDQDLDPVSAGAVLPILHLNGYKSATRRCWRGSSITSTISSCAAGWAPHLVEGDDPEMCTS